MSRVATIQKRRFLRQNRLRLSDLEGIGVGLLDSWSRAQAKVELLDAWFASNGLLDAEGKPHEAVKVYFTAHGAAARALARLSEHLRQPRSRDALSDYLSETYGGADGA